MKDNLEQQSQEMVQAQATEQEADEIQAFYVTLDQVVPELVKVNPAYASVELVAWPENHAYQEFVPDLDSDYVFSEDMFRELYFFAEKLDPNRFPACRISGLHGTGKTTLPLQYYARLNRPCLSYNGKRTTEACDLIGSRSIRNGSEIWLDGPLTAAMRAGIPLVINEWNVIDEDQRIGLNEVLDGRPLFIEEINESVRPMPGFRLFLTQNPMIAGLYQSRSNDDPSTSDRLYKIAAGYPEKEVEEAIVSKHLSRLFPEIVQNASLLQGLAEKFVSVASRVRAMYMGSNQSADALEMTISTRTLVNWVNSYEAWREYEGAVHLALARTLTEGISTTTGRAIHEIVKTEFNEEFPAVIRKV